MQASTFQQEWANLRGRKRDGKGRRKWGERDSARGGNEVSGSHHADGENFLTCFCRKKTEMYCELCLFLAN